MPREAGYEQGLTSSFIGDRAGFTLRGCAVLGLIPVDNGPPALEPLRELRSVTGPRSSSTCEGSVKVYTETISHIHASVREGCLCDSRGHATMCSVGREAQRCIRSEFAEGGRKRY